MKLFIAVTELTRNRWVIFKLMDYFWHSFGENTFYSTTFCCSRDKYRSFQMQMNEKMQLKNDFSSR